MQVFDENASTVTYMTCDAMLGCIAAYVSQKVVGVDNGSVGWFGWGSWPLAARHQSTGLRSLSAHWLVCRGVGGGVM